jgi:hypothetical protein
VREKNRFSLLFSEIPTKAMERLTCLTLELLSLRITLLPLRKLLQICLDTTASDTDIEQSTRQFPNCKALSFFFFFSFFFPHLFFIGTQTLERVDSEPKQQEE